MKCAACEQEMVEKITELDMRIERKLYLASNVKLEECPNCGEQVVDPEIAEEIYDMIKSHSYSLETIDIPVLDLTSSEGGVRV